MSFIDEAAKRVRKTRKSYDLAKESEREYERQRQNNHTKLIQNAVQSAVGRGLGLVGSLSYSSIGVDNFGLDNLSAPDLIPPRPVGPIEEMPLASVISDSIRLQNVLKNTQLVAEHKLKAKTELGKRAYNVHGNTIKSKSEQQLKIVVDLDSESKSAEYKKHLSRIRKEGLYAPGEMWAKSLQYTPTTNPKLRFMIENLAMTDGVMPFPSYITRYNESTGASWDALSFVNAVEDQYVYQRSDKSFDLEFVLFVGDPSTHDASDRAKNDFENKTTQFASGDVVANFNTFELITREDFGLYLEFLNKLVRPRVSGKYIAAVPFMRMTIGDFVDNQFGLIDSVNLNYDPHVWEYQPGAQAPMFVNVAITGKYLYGTPSVDTKYYGEAYE